MKILSTINEYLTDINLKRRAKKYSKEPERSKHCFDDYCILKDDIKYPETCGGISKKKGYFEFCPTVDEIILKAAIDYNPACVIFIKRRPDLFRTIKFGSINEPSYITKPEAKDKKFYYIKIWNTNALMYPHYDYLGYVVCEDEIEKIYRCGHEDNHNF